MDMGEDLCYYVRENSVFYEFLFCEEICIDMKIFIYSGTHWDREWYQCFQGFRYRLVEMVNQMLDDFTDERAPGYGIFHFDGQTVVLEDFLAVEPDKKARLTELIKSGKIVIGPWYCMPDEFLVSGESLIKNMQMGHDMSRNVFGVEPSKTGYICDIFGHIAQMPQIFAGMNIHHSVLGRGTNEHTTDMHFRWQAPDGTENVTFKLPDAWGYNDFTVVAGDTDPNSINVEEMEKRIKQHIDEQIARANVPVLFLLDASDHQHFRPNTIACINAIKKLYPDAEVHHTNIAEMNKAVDAYFSELPIKSGELNETTKNYAPYAHLITNTLSSRYPIKKFNDRMQIKLEKWISPLYASGLIDEPIGFLNLANKYLIKNHPHDSICGCSIDQVHKDMMYRFDQVELISAEIMTRFGRALSGDMSKYAITKNTSDSNEKILRVFNPLPYATRKMTQVEINFEKQWGKYSEPFGYEEICKFKIFDADGNELPYGIADITTFPDKDVYKVSFDAGLVACGITEFRVTPFDMPTRYLERMSQTAKSINNGVIDLSVNDDGTLNILDLETGVEYKNLLTLIDDGEIGDGWFHANPAIDKIVTNTSATVEKIENNINRVVFRVAVDMMLPAAIDRAHFGCRRSDVYEKFTAVHYITVAKGEKEVEIKTVIDNNIKDHRLKLRLPTEIGGKKYTANQAFCFVERETDVKEGTDNWKEYGVAEKQTDGIVAKVNDGKGFAFISAYGIHECAVYANGDIDITLFRSFSKTVGTHGEIGGQLLENLEFNYVITPMGKEDTFPKIQRIQSVLQTGVETATVSAPAAQKYAPILEIENENFIYSTSNKLTNASEIRLYNASNETQTSVIKLPAGVTKAYLTEIDGRQIKQLQIANSSTVIALIPWKIGTIRVEY